MSRVWLFDADIIMADFRSGTSKELFEKCC